MSVSSNPPLPKFLNSANSLVFVAHLSQHIVPLVCVIPPIVCLAAFATDWAGIPRICVRRFVLKIPIDIHSITRFKSSGNDSISSTNYWHFYASWGMGKASNAESSLRTDSIQLRKITMENFSEVLLGSGLRICDWFP